MLPEDLLMDWPLVNKRLAPSTIWSISELAQVVLCRHKKGSLLMAPKRAHEPTLPINNAFCSSLFAVTYPLRGDT